MARYLRITVETGFFGAAHHDEVGLPDDWDEMTETDQQSYIDDCCEQSIISHIDVFGEIVEG